MVASYIRPWEASRLSGVYTGQEAPPNHDIINLVTVSQLHLGCAMSICWMLCVLQVYSPAQDRCSKQIPVALGLSCLFTSCISAHKCLCSS